MTDASGSLRFTVLGPLEARVGATSLPLGGVKPRSILAVLLTDANHVVSAGRIVESLWGDDAGERASNTLQVHISNLRKALTPAAVALGVGVEELVQTRPPGYVIHATATQLDLLEFRDLVALAQHAAATGKERAAAEQYRKALALVRGDPLADLANEAFAAPIITHLHEIVASTRASWVETELMLGRHHEMLPDLEALVRHDPLNEHVRGLLMVALYRCGRQADALAAYQDARNTLIEELGVEPSPELRALEGRVLAHDEALAPRRSATVPDDLRTVLRSSVVVPVGVLVIEGDTERRVDLVVPVTTIGRRADNDVVFDDPQVSRVHAEIRVTAGEFTIVDAGSSNGTYVNGVRVREQRVAVGDEIRIADHRMRFEILGG